MYRRSRENRIRAANEVNKLNSRPSDSSPFRGSGVVERFGNELEGIGRLCSGVQGRLSIFS